MRAHAPLPRFARPWSGLLLAASLLGASNLCLAGDLGSWQHWTDSASRAALDGGTWVPLAGAAIIAAGGWDHAWQRSAAEHGYLFGEDGEDASNDLLTASTLIYAASALTAAPEGETFADALAWKAENLAVFVASKGAVDALSGEIKEASGRDRPDGVPDDAFPSRHGATSAAQTAMTRRNLDYLDMDPALRDAAKVGLHALDGLTGLARIEADQHYPTDVLAGIALGNFVSNFAFNLLLEPGAAPRYSLAVLPEQGGYTVQTQFAF